MSTELRRNPDTGDVERKVVHYEKVELAQLQAAVEENQAAYDQTKLELENARQLTAKLEGELSAQESALKESKSEFAAYNEVAGEGESKPDAGSETVEPKEETGNAESEVVNVEVKTESAADILARQDEKLFESAAVDDEEDSADNY